MAFKYIRFDNVGFVLWPKDTGATHHEMAQRIGDTPLSAGFCNQGSDGEWGCYGKSVSLELEPHESDSKRLTYYDRGY